MREKLIELIMLSCNCLCDLCGDEERRHAVAGVIADNLIANGVTIAEDKNVPSKWIPVTERLPQVGEWVLTYYADKKHRVTKYDSYDGFPLVFTTGLEWVRVTHWMPLPSTEGLE